jgi:hypothetical protein
MIQPEIVLQPKQGMVYDLVEDGSATWIGMPGGRGGAKSGCLQRIMLARRMEYPGSIAAMVMRNCDQVLKYHVDPMLRAYPELNQYYSKVKSKAGEIVLPMPKQNGRLMPPSEIHFLYAESLEDVIRRFRSGNYFDIFVDQAEQFSEAELREIKQAVRSPGALLGSCKFLLAFNMGGVGIDFLRKKFHLHEYNPQELPEDFDSVHFFPWDNVEWSRGSLQAEGLTVEDYYSWPEEKRKEYCATKSDYGRTLVGQDASLVKRDWDSSWDVLEGAFFSKVFDRDKAVLSPEAVSRIIKPWWVKWASEDWGRGHYCANYWHARGEMSPEEVQKLLGWKVSRTLKVVITYREYIAGGAAAGDEGGEREIDERDIGREIVERTPLQERERMLQDGAFFLSPDAFAKRTSKNTIAQELGDVLTKAGMPYPQRADDDVVGGWSLMSNLLLETKREGATGETVWLISANCPELISAIPLLMRDPRDLDRVLKTDKGAAKIEMDTSEAARYGLKSMLAPGRKPAEEEMEDKLAKMRESGLDDNSLYIHRRRLEMELQQAEQPIAVGRRHSLVRRIGR